MTQELKLYLHIAIHWTIAGILTYLMLGAMSTHGFNLWVLIVFMVAAWVTEQLFIRQGKSVITSASPAVVFGAILVGGPMVAALTAASTAVIVKGFAQSKQYGAKMAFNMAMKFWTAAAAGLGYVYLGGVVGVDITLVFPDALVPIVLASLVLLLSTDISVAHIVAAADRVSFFRVLRGFLVPADSVSHVFLTILGVLLAQIFIVMNWVGVLLLAVPLVLSRQIYAVYLQHKEAYVDSLGALVAALEAKDRYTRGHSERVARLSVLVGESMGLGQRELDDLRLAGLLHDIGKISVRGSILRKPEGLSDDEFSTIKDHPAKGAHIVEHIELLNNAIPGIRFHHERPDGTGYYGLQNEDIPPIAKLLAIADAYDSMTSRRSYREKSDHEDAVRELRKWSGKQFDEELVETFIDAVEVESAQA